MGWTMTRKQGRKKQRKSHSSLAFQPSFLPRLVHKERTLPERFEREKETSKESLEVGQKRTTLYLSPILSNCLIDNFSQDYNFSLGGWAKTSSVQPFVRIRPTSKRIPQQHEEK